MQKLHAVPTMKFRSLLVAATLSASAQAVFAETATTKPVSLDDCVALALEHNLGIRIARFAPLSSRLTLSSDYAAYDPSLTTSAGQSFRSQAPQPAGVLTNSFVPPSNEAWSDTY
jgi:outer membrane protein TolC